MIKLKDFVSETMSNVSLETFSDLEKIDEIIAACNEMGENSKLLWRGMRVGKNYPIVHVVQDRDFFRGANLGARTIMKELGVDHPVFAYIGNMQTLTGLFGRTFVVVLKQPYTIFQSDVVDDVMAWAQPTIYKQTNSHGGILRQSVGTRTEKEQIAKAIEGAKTYHEIRDFMPIKDSRNEVIIDAKEYWALDMHMLWSSAGKFVKNFYKEKEPVAHARVMNVSHYLENYGEVVEILSKYRGFHLWKLKNPR